MSFSWSAQISSTWTTAPRRKCDGDGFRIIARKDGSRLRLYSRPGNDFTGRFPLIVEALAWLRARSCIIDGEAVACGGDGVPSFDRIRYRRHDASVFLYAFDLIELNGDDLRRERQADATIADIERRRARCAAGAARSPSLPLETRALAIATFYAFGTAIGGTSAPLIFGYLIESGSSWALAGGYVFAAALMLIAAAVEAAFGIDAEMRSLESVADPLSSE